MKPFDPKSVPLPSAQPPSRGFWDLRPPTILEIGAGVGWHAIVTAKQNPDHRVIAIEHTAEKFAKFHRRHRNHPTLNNLFPVHANAINWITHHVPKHCIDKLYTLFPNPYPKPGQSNKRWHNMPFTEFLIERLKPNGVWVIATNEAFYADEAAQSLSAHPALTQSAKWVYSLANPAPWPARTHFEKKYLQAGQSCTQLEYRRVDFIDGIG